MRLLRSTVAFVLVTLASVIPLRADEIEGIPNWSAPPFWSAPVKWEKGAEATPMSVEGTGPVATPFIAIPPCRIADTRGNGFTGQAGPPTVLANVPRTFQVGGTIPGVMNQCGIAGTAIAVSFQFTVTNMTSAGNLIAWPSGPPPTTSVLNWNANSVAISSGTVVQIGGGGINGSLNVQINAPIGQAANLIIDVNGYYLFGGLDSFYVNENQTNSVNSSMIADGAILNLDISPTAGIVDTKLATIATAGKVADSALSANVTKLGSTIDAGEIANVTRTVSIPVTSFIDCEAGGASLGFASGTDNRADFATVAGGPLVEIVFDDVSGSPDQNSEICSGFAVPSDYVSNGRFRIYVARGTTLGGAVEFLNCGLAKVQDPGAIGLALVTLASEAYYTCTPPHSLVAGDGANLSLAVTSSGAMDDPAIIRSVAFEYLASQ